MPSYYEHRSSALPLAIILAAMTAIISIDSNIPLTTSVMYGATAFALTIVGVALPDIDHHASIPRQKIGAFVSLVTLFAYIFGLTVVTDIISKYFDSTLVGIAAMGILTYFGLIAIPPVLGIIGNLFDSLISHRGFTHSAAFALIAGAILYYLINQASFAEDSILPIVAGGAIFVGIMKHISDDRSG